MPLIKLPPRSDKSTDLSIAKKAKKSSKPTTTVKGGGGIATKIANIKAMVSKYLGKYEEETLIIRNEEELHNYITQAIEFGRIAIDTETTGLDPISDQCVGVCLYSKGQKPCYVPLNHISYITMEKCSNQLSAEVVANELKRLSDTKIVMFNATFDIRVIKNQLGVRLHCWWDCSLASRLLNENEKYGEGGLKALHRKYVLNGTEDAFKFDDLFKGVKFNLVPINVGGIYAAHDAIITDQLYEFQAQHIYYEDDKPLGYRNGMNGVSYTFFNIEMPCVDAVVDMEDTGVVIDIEYAKELSVKYNKILKEKENHFYELLVPYEEQIDKFRMNGAKLDNPINIGSNEQLGVLLYDIIKLEPQIDKRTKKPITSTGEEILSKYDNDICKAILEWRGVSKLVTTYIDKLPNCLNPKDNRLHGRFNQYGADTGRFSSSDPNLQNLPSHNKDIRPMFIASNKEFYVDSCGDYFDVIKWDEVNTKGGWKYADRVEVGDVLIVSDDGVDTDVVVKSVECVGDYIRYRY